MNKRKGFVEGLRHNNKIAFEKITIILQRYYKIYDMDNGTIHSQVFAMLYLSQKYYSYRTICEKLNISKNTLIRYIVKYDELALKIVERLNN